MIVCIIDFLQSSFREFTSNRCHVGYVELSYFVSNEFTMIVHAVNNTMKSATPYSLD